MSDYYDSPGRVYVAWLPGYGSQDSPRPDGKARGDTVMSDIVSVLLLALLTPVCIAGVAVCFWCSWDMLAEDAFQSVMLVCLGMVAIAMGVLLWGAILNAPTL